LVAPGNIEAGIPFPVLVNNAATFNNPVNGTMAISDSIGGGPSPGGFSPIFNPIQVTSGSGSSSQTLYNATPTVLSGNLGNVYNITDTVDVIPMFWEVLIF